MGTPDLDIESTGVSCAPWVVALLFLFACSQGTSYQPPSQQSEESFAQAPSRSASLEPPRSSERQEERQRMVEDQIVRRGVKNESVLEAMRCVPRHWFVPASEQANAYQDSALPIGQGQTISQPYIVALMSEALTLSREDRVLEVGTGSGYQAAVLSELVSQVWTIEIDEVLAERAARTLRERGYTTIQARQGDGYAGWPEAAPFNAIIVTCAPSKIPAPLLEQLAVGGRLCIPVGDVDEVQRLVLVTKQPDGSTQSEVLELVRFVPMTGRSQKE